MKKNFTGQTLARIAVEVGEDQDVRLLVESKTVDWNERIDGEDPAIFWAFNNKNFEMVKILLNNPGIDLKLDNDNNLSLERIARYLKQKFKVFSIMFPETKI